MSLNITKENRRISEAQELIVIRFDPETASLSTKRNKLASIEFFSSGTFAAKDCDGHSYPSEYYIAEAEDFRIFGDWSRPVTCWTTRKTLAKKARRAYMERSCAIIRDELGLAWPDGPSFIQERS